MPAQGVPFVPHAEILQYEEILRLMPAFRALGFRKVKLTGGEPLLRSGLQTLVAGLYQAGFEQVTLTTNGILLPRRFRRCARPVSAPSTSALTPWTGRSLPRSPGATF